MEPAGPIGERGGDFSCPGGDGVPVAEIAHRGTQRRHDGPLGEPELGLVERAGEQPVLHRRRAALDLGDIDRVLIGFRWVTDRSAGEDPHRDRCQGRLEAVHEVLCGREPMAGVNRAAQHHRPDPIERVDVAWVGHHRLHSPLLELGADSGGDLRELRHASRQPSPRPSSHVLSLSTTIGLPIRCFQGRRTRTVP